MKLKFREAAYLLFMRKGRKSSKSEPVIYEDKPKKEKKSNKKQAPVPVMEIGLNSYGKKFFIDTKDYLSVGERDAILASSGMGKSYLMGVILEEIFEKSQQVVYIIDPDGEWHTLVESYNNSTRALKLIRKSTLVKMVLDAFYGGVEPEDFDDLFIGLLAEIFPAVIRLMISEGISAIFDLKAFSDAEQLEVCSIVASAVFKGEYDLDDDDDGEHPECRKVRFVIDEAHVFAPEKFDKETSKQQGKSLKSIIAMAKRGRKRNLHLMAATQRPQSLSKNVTSQLNRFWLGGIQSELDYNANKTIYGEAQLSFETVRKFKSGDFCFFGNGEIVLFRSRLRKTKHGGATKKESTKPILNAEEANKALEAFFK